MPTSPRLIYRPLGTTTLDTFYALAADPYIRRYLLDGQLVDLSWCAQEVEYSERLAASHGVQLWLLEYQAVAIGFAGFRIFEEYDAEPQLVYALTESHTGRGLATEAARACIQAARDAGILRIVAAVDAPNLRSIRLLERLGFVRDGQWPGASAAVSRWVLR
jgi:ribosomal-protein-alanine N-acetyltransferase